ncbi:hypothetical protein SEVIR_7G302950v4 [Setaria viridis]
MVAFLTHLHPLPRRLRGHALPALRIPTASSSPTGSPSPAASMRPCASSLRCAAALPNPASASSPSCLTDRHRWCMTVAACGCSSPSSPQRADPEHPCSEGDPPGRDPRVLPAVPGPAAGWC